MSAQRLAYTSDLTDEAGQILEPLLPPEQPGGRPRKSPMHEVIAAMQSGLRAGCAWRLLPHDLPHGQTASPVCRAGRQDGPWVRMPAQRRDAVRTRMGRHLPPSAAIIAAPTVNTTATGGPTAMTARSSSMGAHAIASWRRRVSSGVSWSTPPL